MDKINYKLNHAKKQIEIDKKDKVENAVENLSDNLYDLVRKLKLIKHQRAKKKNKDLVTRKYISESNFPNFKDFLQDEFKTIHKILRRKKLNNNKHKKFSDKNIKKHSKIENKINSTESFKSGGSLEATEDVTSEISLLKKVLSALENKAKKNSECENVSRQNKTDAEGTFSCENDDCSNVGCSTSTSRESESRNSFGVNSSELEMHYNWLKNKSGANGLNEDKKKAVDTLIDKIKFLEKLYKTTKTRKRKRKRELKRDSIKKSSEKQLKKKSKKHVRFNKSKTKKLHKVNNSHKIRESSDSFEFYLFNLPTQSSSSSSKTSISSGTSDEMSISTVHSNSEF